MVSTSQRVELRCRKCLRLGRRYGRLFDTAWIVNDRLYGITIETDLADEIRAYEAGRPYESPAWMGSRPYINECSRCGNRPELKTDTLTELVRSAAQAGKTVLYI